MKFSIAAIAFLSVMAMDSRGDVMAEDGDFSLERGLLVRPKKVKGAWKYSSATTKESKSGKSKDSKGTKGSKGNKFDQKSACCAGKPTTLKFQLTGGSCVDSTTEQKSFGCFPSSRQTLHEPVTVSFPNDDVIFVDVHVTSFTVGDIFTIAPRGDEFNKDTSVSLEDANGFTQLLSIHTSCSEELDLFDTFGGLTLFGYGPRPKFCGAKPVDPTPAPVIPTVAPVDPTPAPIIPSVAPVDPTPAPVDPTAPPIDPTPAPVDPTPAPVDPTPAPVDPTPAPVDPTPSPVDPTPSPVDPTPAPVDPTPAPVDPTPVPVDPTPAPVDPMGPTPAPVDPAPSPVDPTPAPVDPTPAPVDPTPAPVDLQPSPFDIELELSSGFPTEAEQAFVGAQERWEGIIRSDLIDVSTSSFSFRCFTNGPQLPPIIDDVYICASIIDFPENTTTIGDAGPIGTRLGTDAPLPFLGRMRFDREFAEENPDQFIEVVLHEMAHVLGIGTLWDRTSPPLIDNGSPPCNYAVDSGASMEYRSLSGCTGAVPLEETFNRSGSDCGHWAESCYLNELMTPRLNFGDNPLSLVTIASLEDLGYDVDRSQADPFTSSDLSPSCRCNNVDDTEDLGQSTEEKPTKEEEEAYLEAYEYGKLQLSLASANPEGSNVAPFSDVISVTYMVPGTKEIRSVIVRKEDL